MKEVVQSKDSDLNYNEFLKELCNHDKITLAISNFKKILFNINIIILIIFLKDKIPIKSLIHDFKKMK